MPTFQSILNCQRFEVLALHKVRKWESQGESRAQQCSSIIESNIVSDTILELFVVSFLGPLLVHKSFGFATVALRDSLALFVEARPIGLFAGVKGETRIGELWTRINATESGRAKCENIPALEQDTTAIGADDVDNSVSLLPSRNSVQRRCPTRQLHKLIKNLPHNAKILAYNSLNFQMETFAVIGSSCVERKEGRVFRCSAGAEAFSKRMGWFGTDQELDIVKRFTKVVTGHAARISEWTNPARCAVEIPT
ncbi:BZ3500_MvSof-1268-A1-R1_Chr2-2g04787 [Microbotryum saponariae]|uniref:BZ3500_MvSof-1268-A1-R1_Chr2-2g04787 protein n=1 Tax=Microbotryum saponariae TaxID=289078 RepID=A0A2X0KMN4_9BASI|nr:BZ3500_MvSof-1268-A1-R1_Chr2-2g04787 [Microbotryum saponariae]SDA00165.1 BZ3501_MvSof-1269-A2-R1_Chr2-2g04461 [Microbotryum saponariae]